jgi:hypothetical protein
MAYGAIPDRSLLLTPKPRSGLANRKSQASLRSLQKRADLILWYLLREDDSPMSRRDLSQPSFVDATVSGYGRVGGFLDRIERGFDGSAFEA